MKRAWRPPAVKTFRPSPLALIALLPVLIGADSQPSPLPDASPTHRGAVSTVAQAFGGHKTFDAGIDALAVNASTVQAGELFTPYWFAGGISGNTCISSRTHGDPSPDLYIEGPRDPNDPIDSTAAALLVQENGHGVAEIMVNGQVMGGSQYSHAAFKQNAGSGSGAVTLESQDKGYVVILGRLADTHALLPDGGHPAADGGEWVIDPGDGGTYFDYAGLHGNATHTGVGSMQFPLQILNHTKVGGDDKLFVDPYGGISQPAGLQRASFPALAVNVATSVGQYFYGALESTLLYAADTKSWYHMLDTGTWAKHLTDQDNTGESGCHTLSNGHWNANLSTVSTACACSQQTTAVNWVQCYVDAGSVMIVDSTASSSDGVCWVCR